ncbi:MAG: hypothetical protein KGQ93_11585 [Cyanobacteria bacterium REEB459]|nr:hypothetical protein [Cyanobacteria bacterium REEB459]
MILVRQWSTPRIQPGRRRLAVLLWCLGSGLLAGPAIAGLAPLPSPSLPLRNPVIDGAADPHLRTYDLGLIDVTQRNIAHAPETMPVSLTGVIGLPPGRQAVPLVVILHGRYRGCHFALPEVSQWPCPPNTETRFDLGFAYLAQSLINAGFGVIIPNLNAAFSETYGAAVGTRNQLADQRSQQILDAHLTRLAIAVGSGSNAFGLPLTNRIDWTKLVLVGHSMGGGAAALSALSRSQASPDAIAGGRGPVSALVLVSPTRSYPLPQAGEVYQLADIPTVILLGSCDRDLLDYSSLYYFERADQTPTRQSPLATVLLLGANHNFFNAAVEQDDYYRRADSSALCNPQQSNQRLSRVVQEQFLQNYLGGFLKLVLGPTHGGEGWADLAMAPDRAAPDRLYGLPVLTNLAVPSHQRYRVFTAGLGGATYQASPGLNLAICPQFSACGGTWRLPPFPAVLRLTWQHPAPTLAFSLPPADLSHFSSLQLRLAWVKAAQPNPSGAPLAIVLRDRRGTARRVDIPATAPALHQLPTDSPARVQPFTYATALRIPLSQFRGIDLTSLTSLELSLNDVPQGVLDLATIEFIQ